MARRWHAGALAGFALVFEAVQVALYAGAFGAAVAGLIGVRAVLTLVLAAATVRGATVLRVVLGALRILAGLVGVVMATLVDETRLAVAVGVLRVLLRTETAD